MEHTRRQARKQTQTFSPWWLRLTALVLYCGLVPVGLADDNQQHGMDVVLVMDSSGSMKSTDPKDLRKPAAKMLISLLGKNDRASVVSFSDQGYPVSYLRPTKQAAEQAQLFTAIDKISSRGAYTNIHGALLAAKRVLDKDTSPAKRRLVILMSDGRMDLGDDEKSAQRSQQIFDDILPLFKQENIELQTIAFSDASDKVLLASLAKEAQGQFYVANTDKELHQTFSQIFEDSSRPDMLPMDGGHFHIDEAIQEVTIIGSKDDEQVVLFLTSPRGNRYTHANKPTSIQWLTSPLFDLITIKAPQTGDWHLGASNNNNKAYIITNLSLAMGVSSAEPVTHEEFQLQAWLEQDRQVLIREAILEHLTLSADIQYPDGMIKTLPLTPANPSQQGEFAGIYLSPLSFAESGDYLITVTADSGTFNRSRKLRLHVHEPAVETASAEQEAQKPQATEEPRQEPIQKHTPTEQHGEDGVDLIRIGIIFIGVNIVLGSIAGGVFLVRRRHKKKRSSAGEPHE